MVPSSQNSTSPSALKEPLLTRLPFSRIRSSIVTDLSEKTYLRLAKESICSNCLAYFEMIANEMPILAVGTLDQHGTMVVALFRQAVRRACLADIASKGELV